jgi:hypothetical protein
VEGYQGEIMGFWEQYGGEMMATLPSMTLDTFKYARALVSAASGLQLLLFRLCVKLPVSWRGGLVLYGICS